MGLEMRFMAPNAFFVRNQVQIVHSRTSLSSTI